MKKMEEENNIDNSIVENLMELEEMIKLYFKDAPNTDLLIGKLKLLRNLY